MAKSANALIKPDLLEWTRKDAGFGVEEAARKIGTTPERLAGWEQGDSKPTVNQLRKLAAAYKRPLALFYLPVPPEDTPAIRDFRRLPGTIFGSDSPQLRFEKRRAQFRRDTALELFPLIEHDPPEFPIMASLSDDPELIGVQIRDTLGITYADQVRRSRQRTSFNYWREAIEEIGVLVFQMWLVDNQEARGFSYSGSQYPVIALNSKDSLAGRTFTLLHELAHLTLREGGLCDLLEERQNPSLEGQTEIFCNAVAGATLVPRDYLLLESSVSSNAGSKWADDEIFDLAAKFGVSRETLLRRLLICGKTTADFYAIKRSEYLAEPAPSQRFPVPYRYRVINRSGRSFTKLILENYLRDNITGSDVAEYLEVQLKHLPDIEREVMGSATSIT
ncbi:MAG: hypothetical protein BZY80_07180 [SAR202 cluster bacterium Io17-Chloro-G2]|nr:MAG: hypothetical protein BZY80_07180 [SAR202 cluster bacterium Io17-Chloro-G2]